MNKKARTTSEPNLFVDGVSVSRLSQRGLTKSSKPWGNPEGIFTNTPNIIFQKSAPTSAKLPVLHHTRTYTKRPMTATSTSSEPGPRINRSSMLRQRIALGHKKEEQLKLEEERRRKMKLKKQLSSTSLSNLSQIKSMHSYIPKHHLFTYNPYEDSSSKQFYENKQFEHSWNKRPATNYVEREDIDDEIHPEKSSSNSSSKHASVYEFLGRPNEFDIRAEHGNDHHKTGPLGLGKRLSLDRLSSYSGRHVKPNQNDITYQPSIPTSYQEQKYDFMRRNKAAAKIQKNYKNYLRRKYEEEEGQINLVERVQNIGDDEEYSRNMQEQEEYAARVIQRNYKEYKSKRLKNVTPPITTMFLDEFFNQAPRNSLHGSVGYATNHHHHHHHSPGSTKSYRSWRSEPLEENLQSFSHFASVKNGMDPDVAIARDEASEGNRNVLKVGLYDNQYMPGAINGSEGFLNDSSPQAQQISETNTLKNESPQTSSRQESARNINIFNGYQQAQRNVYLTQSFDTSFLPRLNNPAFDGRHNYSSLFDYLEQISQWDQERFEKISARESIFPSTSVTDFNNQDSETLYLLDQIINEKHALNELCSALLHTTIDLNSKLATIETREKLALETIVKNHERQTTAHKNKETSTKLLSNSSTQTD